MSPTAINARFGARQHFRLPFDEKYFLDLLKSDPSEVYFLTAIYIRYGDVLSIPKEEYCGCVCG
jgi:hypothetical protein